MDTLLYLTQNPERPLHHFYLLDGDKTVLETQIKNLITARGITIPGNLDVSFQSFSQFNVEDAQNLRDMLSVAAVGARFIVFSVASFTNGALQSLLKVLEESTAGTHLFFIVPNLHALPETIRSRAHVIATANTLDDVSKKSVTEFLEGTIQTRIKQIDTLLKKEDSSGGEREAVRLFLDALESALSEKKNDQKSKTLLNDILEYKRYLLLPGAHVRMILESLAVRI